MRARTWGLALLLIVHGSAAQAQLNTWLNQRVDSLAAMRIAMRDPGKQAQAPVASLTGESLVETAVMPDVGGISVTLPNFGSSTGAQTPGTMSLSGTIYTLLGALSGRPLDPTFYFGNQNARRFGFNATFDTDSAGNTSTLVQAKLLVLDRGNALDHDSLSVSQALQGATAAFRRLRDSVTWMLYDQVGVKAGQDSISFLNSLGQAGPFQVVLAAAGSDGVAAIDAMIESVLSDFIALRDVVERLSQAARSKPRLGLGFTGSTAGVRADNFRAVAIFDVGRSNYDVTINGGYDYTAAVDTLPEQHRVELSGQLLFRLTPADRLGGRSPLSLAIGGSGSMKVSGAQAVIFKLQAKLNLPIAEGVDLPVSGTWASRTDLIDESEVRGHIGFSFGMAQLLSALR